MNNIAIFASGSGTNAEAIMNYFENNPQRGRVAALLSNNAEAYALIRAEKHGVETLVFSAKQLRENSAPVIEFLDKINVKFIVLAGYMLLIPSSITSRYPNRIVNIHPALLPAYGGKGMYGDNVHRAVIAAGEKQSGITIHYVNEHYDEGNIIFQATVSITPDDTPETLAAKIHTLEHTHYPEIIAQLLSQDNELTIDN